MTVPISVVTVYLSPGNGTARRPSASCSEPTFAEEQVVGITVVGYSKGRSEMAGQPRVE